MLNSLKSLLEPAIAERLTLVINHVLAAEAAATERLRPHAGRTLRLAWVGWPAPMPAPPPMAWRVTPAGLLEWCGPDGAPLADLSIQVTADNPALLLARMLAGETPPVQIDGDAKLAGDVNWLIENLRWDVAADLERAFGPWVGPQLHRIGSVLADGLRAAVKAAAALGQRLRPRGS